MTFPSRLHVVPLITGAHSPVGSTRPLLQLVLGSSPSVLMGKSHCRFLGPEFSLQNDIIFYKQPSEENMLRLMI